MKSLAILGRIAAIALILLFARSIWTDYTTQTGRPPGWDARAVCSGNDAYRKGLNPYYVSNLTGTDLSYTYPPFTFDLFKPLCTEPFDIRVTFRYLYPLLLLFLIGLFSTQDLAQRQYDRALTKTVFLMGGFTGFHWAYLTGNIAAIEGTLLASGIFCFYPGKKVTQNELSPRYFLGAALLGFSSFLKVINFPIVFALYFVPVDRRKKLTLIAIGLFAYALPMGISVFGYHDLFTTFVHAISGKIPNQHSPATEGGNPSVFFLVGHFLNLARKLGLDVDSHYFALQASGYTLIILSIAALFFRRIFQLLPKEGRASPLTRLDSALSNSPRFAFYAMTLAILGMLVSLPRMKSYAYFSVAAVSALLVAELPPEGLFLAATFAIVIPLFDWSARAFGGFQQTVGALVVWAVSAYFLKRSPSSTIGVAGRRE